MIAELWENFPRFMERNINALLEEAEPNPHKAYQLYKVCQREDLWRGSFEEFSKRLGEFFARPRAQRRKSDLDRFLERPIDRTTYEGFQLNFRTAVVNGRTLQNLANWAHNLMRVGYKTTSLVISLDVLTKALNHVTNPPLFEKAENIEFEDFCAAWTKTVFRLFGNRRDSEFTPLLNELRRLDVQSKIAEKEIRAPAGFPTIYLTQTEIDWTIDVREAAFHYATIPKFPLSRGPTKQFLIDLERAATLYNIVQTTRLPELLKQRENIRMTILDRCDRLLREKAS